MLCHSVNWLLTEMSGTVTEWHYYAIQLPFRHSSVHWMTHVQFHPMFAWNVFNLLRPTTNIQGSFGLVCFHAWTDAVLKTLLLWNNHVIAYILVHPDWPCGITAQLSAILIVTHFFLWRSEIVQISKCYFPKNATGCLEFFLKTLQDVLSLS